MPSEARPLAGKRVLVTRSAAQAGSFIARLEGLGAYVIPFPAIELTPPPTWDALHHAVQQLDQYDWTVFTSVNGVRFFCQYLDATGQSPSVLDPCRVAAIGPATARALAALGVRVHLVPPQFVAEGIVASLGAVAGQRFLLPRAAQARETLARLLREGGAVVDEIAVYDTLLGEPSPESLAEARRGVDIATFTSSSTVRNVFTLLGEETASLLSRACIACIGPITVETARDYGLTPDIVAETYTTDGLIEAIVRHCISLDMEQGEG